MPFTELWLSNVSRYSPSAPKGYASPTSFSACVAFAVKMTAYSSGSALKNVEHREPRLFDVGGRQRGCRIGRVRVAEQMIAQQRHVAIDQRQRHEIAGGVVEIDVPEAVEQRILARAQIVERARGSSEYCGRRLTTHLGDCYLPRILRVIFQEGLLRLELFGCRLHSAGGVDDARYQRVLARRRVVPRIGEQLPRILRARRGIDASRAAMGPRRRAPRPISLACRRAG